MSSSRHLAQHIHISSADDSPTPSPTTPASMTPSRPSSRPQVLEDHEGQGRGRLAPLPRSRPRRRPGEVQPVESRTSRPQAGRQPPPAAPRHAEGKRILQLLSNRHIAMMQPKESSAAPKDVPSSGSSSSASPSPPRTPPLTRVPSSYVYIDVLPDTGAPSPAAPVPLLPASPACPSANTFSSGPRTLRSIDPTVTFLARAPLAAQSAFRVLRGGVPVHAERTELELLSSSCMPAPQWPSEMECTFLYRTAFVPAFWDMLCACPDPSSYTIVQEIVRTGDAHGTEDVLLSIPLAHAHARAHSELGTAFDELLLFGGALTPALLHRDEDGYASSSLPPSPLDLAAPPDAWHHPPPALLCAGFAEADPDAPFSYLRAGAAC
ncbi:hypothetical protein A0H81_14140 [Grifola frondosa]|uniref:Uncharacterized protein n=1 Tax=Grifola frondosa TaxID=5627 RepID=A0A1C7LPN5_GRIFR|nr:hypothetical protein A0H81_14140 [Grifola frondosa]